MMDPPLPIGWMRTGADDTSTSSLESRRSPTACRSLCLRNRHRWGTFAFRLHRALVPNMSPPEQFPYHFLERLSAPVLCLRSAFRRTHSLLKSQRQREFSLWLPRAWPIEAKRWPGWAKGLPHLRGSDLTNESSGAGFWFASPVGRGLGPRALEIRSQHVPHGSLPHSFDRVSCQRRTPTPELAP